MEFWSHLNLSVMASCFMVLTPLGAVFIEQIEPITDFREGAALAGPRLPSFTAHTLNLSANLQILQSGGKTRSLVSGQCLGEQVGDGTCACGVEGEPNSRKRLEK